MYVCVCVCDAATSIARQLYQFSVERKDKQSNGNESLGNGRHTSVELLPFFSLLKNTRVTRQNAREDSVDKDICFLC